jgi:hypothetical protein
VLIASLAPRNTVAKIASNTKATVAAIKIVDWRKPLSINFSKGGLRRNVKASPLVELVMRLSSEEFGEQSRCFGQKSNFWLKI